MAEVSRRLRQSEQRREELTDLKFAHEAELRELRGRSEAGEAGREAASNDAKALREANRALEARAFEAEREAERLRMQGAALAQQVSFCGTPCWSATVAFAWACLGLACGMSLLQMVGRRCRQQRRQRQQRTVAVLREASFRRWGCRKNVESWYTHRVVEAPACAPVPAEDDPKCPFAHRRQYPIRGRTRQSAVLAPLAKAEQSPAHPSSAGKPRENLMHSLEMNNEIFLVQT